MAEIRGAGVVFSPLLVSPPRQWRGGLNTHSNEVGLGAPRSPACLVAHPRKFDQGISPVIFLCHSAWLET